MTQRALSIPASTRRCVATTLLLLLSSLSFNTHAFVPSSLLTSQQLLHVRQLKKNSRELVSPLDYSNVNLTDSATSASFPSLLTTSTTNRDAAAAKAHTNNILQLDPLAKTLDIIQSTDDTTAATTTTTTVLQGIDPTLWHAARPIDGDPSSLFLYTQPKQHHPNNKKQGASTTFDHVLGKMASRNNNKLLACARLSRYWMGPKAGTKESDVPFDTQFLLVELNNNNNNNNNNNKEPQYALLLPLLDQGFRTSLHHNQQKDTLSLMGAAESGTALAGKQEHPQDALRALYVGVGDDPFQLVHQGFAQVARATGTFLTLDDKVLPPHVDDFGWCTWDAFYSKVTPAGILKGVQSLSQAGVPPKTLILDDGWQQVSPEPPDWQQRPQEVVNAVTDIDITRDSPNENDFAATMLESDSLLGKLFGVAVMLVEGFYEQHVRTAPVGSWGPKVWRFLSRTILKSHLWTYFDTETDYNRQLSGFAANFKFESSKEDQDDNNNPKTLKELVGCVKDEFGVARVYCWHALHGYWRGVSQELGQAVGLNVTELRPTRASEHLSRLEPQSAWDPVSLFGVGILGARECLEKFYEHLHTPLLEAGVDGVKVDVQSGVSAGIGGGMMDEHTPHYARLYTEAMEESVSKRFPAENGASNSINCMCHSTENLYRYKSTSVARASDDFFPARKESQTTHLVNVAYNSLFLGEICLPDWDMFHSLHESGPLHGAARAVGGCPIYVSDKPGEHDIDLLRKLVLPDGSILRANRPGRPTRDCLFADVTADGTSALKVWNENNYGGVVGAFHVQGVQWNFDLRDNQVLNKAPKPLTAVVKPYDVESLRNEPNPFVAWRHRSETLEFLPDGNSEMKAKLNHRDWEIFTIVPVQIKDRLMFAPIGLVNMMNSGGGLKSVGSIERKEPGSTSKTIHFECRGPGRVVAFTNEAPASVALETDGGDSSLGFVHDEETGELSFLLPPETTKGVPHTIQVLWN